MPSHTFTIAYGSAFFDEAAQRIWQKYGGNPCTWRQTLILVPNIRSSLSLREALIRLIPPPAFCPRIISFKNMPEHVGLQNEKETLSSPQQVAMLFDVLDTPAALQRWEQAQSWQRQTDELARSANTILNEEDFTDLLQPLWPGSWSPILYDIYSNSSTMRLREQSETIWNMWTETPPQFPLVVVGSTGSTVVSGGWVHFTQNHTNGLVIERKSTENLANKTILMQAPHSHAAAHWLSSEIEKKLKECSSKRLTIVSALPFEELYQQLITRGIDVDRGEYAHFRNTPTGQFWACLMQLFAHPSSLLLWDCLKRVSHSSEDLNRLELQCRQEKMFVAAEHLHLWDYIEKRPQTTPLSAWWHYIFGFIQKLSSVYQHPILHDLQTWPQAINVLDVQQVAANLLPYIDAWWPIPLYRFVREEKPKVQWVGPWEARGLESDYVWVCGLNEGAWPTPPDIEAWLPTYDRTKLGLPDAQHFEKLSYHDLLCTLGAAPHVTWLTLANQTPSRWLAGLPYHTIKASLKGAGAKPPPPIGLMQEPIKRISVTEADRLMRDPYAYYIRSILRLQELEPLQSNDHIRRTARDKGLLFHDVMQRCVQQGNNLWNSLFNDDVVVEFFWLHQMQSLLPGLSWGADALCEANYSLKIGDIYLKGRLDRIDLNPFEIVNYKTGALPSVEAIKNGWAPQLALETLIAAHHHKQHAGTSTLLALKHTPESRSWSWTQRDLESIRELFIEWLGSIDSFPANGSPSIRHMARTA